MKIAVIDYQSGNLGSVLHAMKTAAPDAEVFLAHTAEALVQADRWVFPGQGAIPQAMQALEQSQLIPVMREGFGVKPILGICVGMQMLFEQSEEVSAQSPAAAQPPPSHHPSLGWIAGEVKKFPPLPELKVPHMGWSQVQQARAHPMWRNIKDQARFYFAHSFYCAPSDPALMAGRTDYGVGYASAITLPKLFAVQFHPEKSGRDGLQLLKNFVDATF